MKQNSAPLHIHIPTPGDHYSPATGSALMTIIHHVAVCYAAQGGETMLIVNRGTRHDYQPGQCVEVNGHPYPAKWQKAVDLAMGRIGAGRPFGTRLYRPHLAAIPSDFDGPLFIHNNPAAITLARKMRPLAKLCLYVNNELFRVYSDREVNAVVRACDRVICVSHFIAQQIKRRMGAELEDRLRVVHSGVDVEQFCPPREKAENAEPVILFVGRVQPVKGPDLLIQAAVKLAAQNVPFKLKIVGSQNFNAADPLTPFERRLRELAQPIESKVEFQPFTSRGEITALYQAADINVVPSNWDEPLGLTVLEGLACGLPSVVARRGGIPEIAGDAALYFDPPDVDQLAAQLRTLLASSQTRRDYSAKSLRQAGIFAWPRQFSILEQAIA
jgi:glycosyltransferase involved in cell wall biosynthesis